MKRYFAATLLLFLLVSCAPLTAVPTKSATASLPVTANPTLVSTSTPAPDGLPGAGEIALAHMDAISNGIGLRPAGTDQESQTATYIVLAFEKMRIPSQVQPFTVTVDGKTVQSANVIALRQGTSPREIIVGAHYDSVRVGKGADDNASGVSVILEVAQRLQDRETPYTIRFILFGAEELGMKGSSYYVAHMTDEQKQNTIAMINLDSVTAGDFAYVYGDPGEKGVIRDWALQYAEKNHLSLQTQPGENPKYPAGTTGDWSDQAPFKAAGIPYAYFESTNWTLGDKDGYTQVDPQYGENGEIWHTSYDTLDYLNATFPGRVEERLHLFVTVLEAILTGFQAQ